MKFPALVDELLAERAQARARKDFAAADAVRARLLAAGIAVEDTPDGPVWTLKTCLQGRTSTLQDN